MRRLGYKIFAVISHHCNIIVIVSGTTDRILIENCYGTILLFQKLKT